MTPRRCPPKSRATAEKLRVIVHAQRAAEQCDPPGYSGHNGGQFSDAGYAAGRGLFGFRQDVR